MSADQVEIQGTPREELKSPDGQSPPVDSKDNSEEKTTQDKRGGIGIRIPIFFKLAILSTLLLVLVISIISFSMLEKQKKQFIAQLIVLGESMLHVVSENAPDKLLGEEDLALFKLVKDISQNEQVVYALITDKKGNIKAHSNIEKVDKAYSPPANMSILKKSGDFIISAFIHGGEEILFFQTPIIYQKIKIGDVRVAISQEKILENIREAKIFILLLTIIIIFLGIILSLILSIYFSRPINKLQQSTKALGMGDFEHRVTINRKDEFGDLGSAFNQMAEDLALKETIKASFGRYVTPEIVDLILENPDSRWMKGSRIEVSVLFVDIRGFTSLSENKDPESIVEMLNDYFTWVTDIVIKHKGHINKFVGDEAMAVFGAPVPMPQHAEAAVMAGIDIQKKIASLDEEKGNGHMAIKVGVGINSGEMVAGNLGSQKRMEYTVIGDNVNVASRLTSLAKAGEIVISKQTYDLIEDKRKLEVEERGTVAVKGRKMEISIFNVKAF